MFGTFKSDPGPPTRRSWVKQIMLGSAAALCGSTGWRGHLLAEISPATPASDIIPIRLSEFPGLLDGSTPSIQLQLSALGEVIMITRAPFSGELFVIDSKCTHRGCIVGKWDLNSDIVCPCHGSNYRMDGSLIWGAAGPSQPPLRSYNFTYDGLDLLKIEVPGLDLEISRVTVQTVAGPDRRIKLSFPGHAGSVYQVNRSSDLVTWEGPVLFSTTVDGIAAQTSIQCPSQSTPLDVWVDSSTESGFYRIELILSSY